MTIGFISVSHGDRTHLACADRMIRSVRQTMAGLELVQLSDLTSPRLSGVDRIIRRQEGPLALVVAQHYAACGGEWLFIDADVIVQRDVRDVFADVTWDLAVAVRQGECESTAKRRAMPYNAGVVFSRSSEAWADIVRRVAAMPIEAQHWFGNQQALCDVIATNQYRVRLLTASYNWAPSAEDEDVSAQHLVHYKGAGRKAWLLTPQVLV